MPPEADGPHRGMTVSLIVAMAHGRVIGQGGALPWHLPADLRHFKSLTMGKPIIMGRATHESIGRALPGRHNIVLTRQADYAAEGCTVVSTPEAALEAAAKDGADEVMIIGGAAVYEAFLPMTARLYLTEIDADLTGDTRFPVIDFDEWEEASRELRPADDKNPYPHAFIRYERKGRGRSATARVHPTA